MINENIKLGVINTLKINRISEPGLYLSSLDEEEVLLPNTYIKDGMDLDDEIDVFIYTDSEDRLVATTESPLGFKDQFIFAEVVDTINFGAFVDWGLKKDLFVPKNRQKTPFKEGEKRIIRIVEDEQTNRLIGVEKIGQFLSKEVEKLKKNDPVKILVVAKTPLGYKVIVDNSYEGLIYKNEIFQDIYVGLKLDAFIKSVREDKKLDISLQPIGKTIAKDINDTKILDILKQNHGTLPYNYKTDPDEIKDIFGLSKKAYKRALTSLQEKNLITIEDSGITLKYK